jgi:aspartyl-tRNA synthetase
MEFSWIDSHEDVMSLEERWLEHVLGTIAKEHGAAIKELFGVDVVVPKVPFPRVTMSEAQGVLKQAGHKTPKPGDLDPEGERILSKHVAAEHKHEFVFVTDYPSNVRPFYHMRHADNSELTKSFDLLWKGVEITTGAQREHRYDALKAQALDKGMKLEPIQFYLDFFRYGCPPHGGLGFGLSRMLMQLLGLPSVREAQFIFRGPNRLTP